MSSIRQVQVFRNSPDGTLPGKDELAVEEPMEIRLDGHPVAIVMRTPGHDEELVAGFLVTEGIISSAGHIRKIEARPEENRVLVFLHEHIQTDLGRLTRHVFSASSCGLCGKTTLDAIFTHSAPILNPPTISDEALLAAPTQLRAAQSVFDSTGGLHAAGIFDLTGKLLFSREDVGRHNAVDKVIGHALLNDVDLSASFLLVSGRLSFEILQKSLASRIPIIAGISAPSSLAVEFAHESGQQLIGFLRPPTFNRYC